MRTINKHYYVTWKKIKEKPIPLQITAHINASSLTRHSVANARTVLENLHTIECSLSQRLPVSGLSDLIGTNGALCSTELECALNLARALCCFSSSSSCNRRNHCTENCTQLCLVQFRFQTSKEIMDDNHTIETTPATTQIAFFLACISES